MTRSPLIPLITLALATIVFIWSAINPYERGTWWMEVAPALIALPLLAFTYKRFRLTDLSYALIGIHASILMIGGKYTYALVPLFDFIEGTRNNYDKLGHFAQGFIPAIIIRELLLRTSPMQPGKWLAAVIIFSCLGISAVYELVEWLAAVLLGQGAEEFLGTQGDEWDTQKDMLWAGIGACTALLSLSHWHNRQLEKI